MWFIFAFLFISGTAWLETHFVFHTLIFSVFSALFIIKLDNLFIKKNFRYVVPLILVLILIINLFILAPQLTSKTAISKMRSYTIGNIDKNSLVIVDSRVFRGRIAFMFNDRYYLEASYLPQIISTFGGEGIEKVPIKTYFIECAADDCGWGTIKDQPELNRSMEQLVSDFRNFTSEKVTIYSGSGVEEIKGEPYFRVYEVNMNLNPAVLEATKQTHSHYFYPVNWEGEVYDRYNTKDSLGEILNDFGFWIFYFTIFLEVLSPFVIIWFFKREHKNLA